MKQQQILIIGGAILGGLALMSFAKKSKAQSAGEPATGSAGLFGSLPTAQTNAGGIFGALQGILAPTNQAATAPAPNMTIPVASANIQGLDYKSMSTQAKQNLWLYTVAQTGAGPNNTNDVQYQLMQKFGMTPYNNEILNAAVMLFPDVQAASGFDNKYKVLNPKLQAAGASFTLQRVNKTGVAGAIKGIADLSKIVAGAMSGNVAMAADGAGGIFKF